MSKQEPEDFCNAEQLRNYQRNKTLIDLECIPKDVKSVIYNFDQEAARWRLSTVFTDEKKFVNSENGWKLTT